MPVRLIIPLRLFRFSFFCFPALVLSLYPSFTPHPTPQSLSPSLSPSISLSPPPTLAPIGPQSSPYLISLCVSINQSFLFFPSSYSHAPLRTPFITLSFLLPLSVSPFFIMCTFVVHLCACMCACVRMCVCVCVCVCVCEWVGVLCVCVCVCVCV